MSLPLSSTPKNRQRVKRARVGSNSCPKCEKEIQENKHNITCSICELRYCLPCTNVPGAVVAALKGDIAESFKWTCNVCKYNFPCMSNLSDQLDVLEESTHSLTKQLNTIEETTHKRLALVESSLEELDNSLDTRIQRELTS